MLFRDRTVGQGVFPHRSFHNQILGGAVYSPQSVHNRILGGLGVDSFDLFANMFVGHIPLGPFTITFRGRGRRAELSPFINHILGGGENPS